MMKKAILCVDDEEIILQSLKEQLETALGNTYIYETAESADEGFEIIEELVEEGISISLIVSDWLMPGIKGDEFLTRVHNKYPDIASVLLTGHANQSAIERAKRDANLYTVINKPWALRDLVRIIKEISHEY